MQKLLQDYSHISKVHFSIWHQHKSNNPYIIILIMEMRNDNSHLSRTTFNLHCLMPQGGRSWVKGERRQWIFIAAVWSRGWSRTGRGSGVGMYGMKRRRSRGGHPLCGEIFIFGNLNAIPSLQNICMCNPHLLASIHSKRAS